MVESFASSEDQGMIALTLREGGEIWLAAASVYAVEKDPNEPFTMVKTMGEPIAVTETPRVIFDTIEAIQRNSSNRAEQRMVDEFVDFVTENEIDVSGVRDRPIELLESDVRMKEIRRRGLATNEKLSKEEAEKLRQELEAARKKEQFFEAMKHLGLSEDDAKALLGVAPAETVEAVPTSPSEAQIDAMSDEEYRGHLRGSGVADDVIETIIVRRAEERFDQAAQEEFGEDLGSAMERLREREEKDRGTE